MALTTVRPQGMGFNTGRRNLIINGAMQVAQRGTSGNDCRILHNRAFDVTLIAHRLHNGLDGTISLFTKLRMEQWINKVVKSSMHNAADTSLSTNNAGNGTALIEAQNVSIRQWNI